MNANDLAGKIKASISTASLRAEEMFPTHLEGRFECGASVEGVDATVDRIMLELRRAHASEIVREGNVVTFRAGIFRLVPNWNVLVPVGSGIFEVRPGNRALVNYRFSFVQLLVVVTIMVALMTLMLTRSNAPFEFRLGFPVFAWAWLFGMNYLVAAFRLPAFARRAAGA